METSTKKLILPNLFFIITISIIQVALIICYINTVPLGITLFNFVLFFSYLFLGFYSLIKTIKLQTITRSLEMQENYNKSLTTLYDNIRGFKHDFDNMLNIIDGYLSVNDIDGFKSYYSDLRADRIKTQNIEILNPNVINNPGIYNLIVSKYKKAIKLNINIQFDFFFDFNNLHMPFYEFSRILGILLDNAIEATAECEQKELFLTFRESPRNNVQIISIENTYKNKNIDTKKIFEKGFSGKHNHTGLGLWEINKIINKNDNIVLNTFKDDRFFKQQLEIYY